jgi:DNA-binding transcriptional LysR family regulator
MELRQIRYFLAVCDEGQFIKAAKKLHITQSALSQQIQSLEKFLGVYLFDPHKRKVQRIVTLTDEGNEFLSDARKIVTYADKVIQKFKAISKNNNSVRLGTYNLLNRKEIIKTVNKITEMIPDAEFKIIQFTNPTEVQKALGNDLIDCGITILPVVVNSMNYIRLNQVTMSLLINKSSSLNDLKKITLSELKNELWIEIDHKVHPMYENIGDNCRKAGLTERKIVQEVPSLELLCHFVDKGKGIAFIPSYIDISEYNQCVMREISDDFTAFDQVLCFKEPNNFNFKLLK